MFLYYRYLSKGAYMLIMTINQNQINQNQIKKNTI